jgi:DNA-binding SARP family transcriptional activator/Tfp pilus assembly protein PilF/DNA-binding XRE family transcriptional regulator
MPHQHSSRHMPEPDGGRTCPTGAGPGALLRAHRRAAGLTQAELAERAGLGLGTVRDVEQGRSHRPSRESVRRLVNALSLDAAAAEVFQGAVLAGADSGAGLAVAGDRREQSPQAKPGRHTGGLWLQVLGPLQAWRGPGQLELGAVKQRVVLGILALAADSYVHRDGLIDALWGDDPPSTAVSLVQAYVSGLRRILDPGRAPRDPHGLLVSAGECYRLQAVAGQLDLLAFRELAREAQSAGSSGDLPAACDAYGRALGLWQGQPLADLGTLQQHPSVIAITREWATAACEYGDAAAAAGRHELALPYLVELAGREPLDEKAHARLMVALAGTGQQAAALRVFEDLRRRLDDQLGVRPGPEVAEAHVRILRQQIAAPRLPSSAPVVPRQLPARVAGFAGREAELDLLSRLLGRQKAEPAGAVVISAIGGMAGVGKTALAVHWAHQEADRFPDGQLYANLRGFGPLANPAAPGAVLRHFLAALGIAPQRIPADPDAQAGLYRSVLAGKKMLIVLDNARDEAQARPLLPASPTCLVLVTSRTQLAGLAAAEGACQLGLDVLSETEASELLAARLGAHRVAGEPDAAAELISLCGRLPLALAVIAARAATRPRFPLAALAAELRDEHTRLSALDAGDPLASVAAAFTWSYRQLADPAARMFRLLGLHPGPDFTPYAAASLAHLSLEQARELLLELARAHLVNEPAPGRFAFHDLLRAYAAQQARATDSEAERHAALTRLFDHYLAAAASAMNILVPADQHRRPEIPEPTAPLPPLGSPRAALSWLDAERATLVAVAESTGASGWPAHTIRLSVILFRYYLDMGGHYLDGLAVYESALRAARQTGDHASQAEALRNRSAMDFAQSRHEQAASQLRQALAISRRLNDRRGEARALGNLGLVLMRQGRNEEAADHIWRSLGFHRELGDRFGLAIELDNFGDVLCRQGRYEQALDYHRQSLSLRRELGDEHGVPVALGHIGFALCRQGRWRQASVQLRRALAMFQRIGDKEGEAETLNDLGEALRGQGRCRDAVNCHQRAYELFATMGNRHGEAGAANGLGEALCAVGDHGQAKDQHYAALTMASQMGDRREQARAHHGLACAYQAAGQGSLAQRHAECALALSADRGVPMMPGLRRT